MAKENAWDEFLNTRVVDAAGDYVKGSLDSTLKAASIFPFTLGYPDEAKQMYFLLNEKNPSVYNRYGRWSTDIDRGASLASLQAAAMLKFNQGLGNVIGTPTGSSVLGGSLAVADNEMEKQIQARMLGEFRNMDETNRDALNGTVNTAMETASAAGSKSKSEAIKGISTSFKKHQVAKPVGFVIDESMGDIEYFANALKDYLYNKKLEELKQSIYDTQD